MRSTLLAVPLLALAAVVSGPAHAADPVSAKPDPIAGKVIFEHTCANCHSLDVGVNKVGPSLWHVVNRPSGTIEGYDYSQAMKNLNAVWTPEALNVYLQNPRGDVHGAKMFFKGLPDPKDRADVIAYLEGFL